jgi:hypothetical protein
MMGWLEVIFFIFMRNLNFVLFGGFIIFVFGVGGLQIFIFFY